MIEGVITSLAALSLVSDWIERRVVIVPEGGMIPDFTLFCIVETEHPRIRRRRAFLKLPCWDWHEIYYRGPGVYGWHRKVLTWVRGRGFETLWWPCD